MIITPFEDIKKELQDIQSFCEAHFEADIPDACVSRAQTLENYMARTGKLLADVGYHRDTFENSAITDTIKDALSDGGWPAKVITDKIRALAKEYNIVMTWAERLNRTCTHSHQFMITMVSKHKEEMKMNRFGGGGVIDYGVHDYRPGFSSDNQPQF